MGDKIEAGTKNLRLQCSVRSHDRQPTAQKCLESVPPHQVKTLSGCGLAAMGKTLLQCQNLCNNCVQCESVFYLEKKQTCCLTGHCEELESGGPYYRYFKASIKEKNAKLKYKEVSASTAVHYYETMDVNSILSKELRDRKKREEKNAEREKKLHEEELKKLEAQKLSEDIIPEEEQINFEEDLIPEEDSPEEEAEPEDLTKPRSEFEGTVRDGIPPQVWGTHPNEDRDEADFLKNKNFEPGMVLSAIAGGLLYLIFMDIGICI